MVNKIQQIVKQLFIVGRIYTIINIQEFIKLLGNGVEDLLKDLIKYIVELYIGLNYNIKIDEEAIK